MTFDKIFEFEQKLAEYTGAKCAIMTDCCTHALELCFRFTRTKKCMFTQHTYLSIPMLMHKLNIEYQYVPEKWTGQYNFYGTMIIDAARRLEKNMYSSNTMACLSFGAGKPLNIGHGGAILLDNDFAYERMITMRYDGRDLKISPWQDQKVFRLGFHYRPAIEDAVKGLELLEEYKKVDMHKPVHVEYPNLTGIKIENYI